MNFFHGLVMVDDGCLLELDTCAEVVTSIVLDIVVFHKVWLSFGEIDPFRVSLFVNMAMGVGEESIGISPGVQGDHPCCWSDGVWALGHPHSALLIARHVKSISASFWRNKPCLVFAGGSISVVSLGLEIKCKTFGAIVATNTLYSEPVTIFVL